MGIYCGVIAATFLLLKMVNYRLHHVLDEGEVVERQTKENQGRRGGINEANDEVFNRGKDSNGPGYVLCVDNFIQPDAKYLVGTVRECVLREQGGLQGGQ